MSVAEDLRILYHLVFKSVSGNTHEERLESFYEGQAGGYDSFRERLLKGRKDLLCACEDALSLSMPEGESTLWVDLGGGTARNLAFVPSLREKFSDVVVVDLSQSLLEQAQQRCQSEGWSNVTLCHADATKVEPLEGEGCENVADLVTLSYSLTMIPDWFLALEHAYKLLKPGGLIGIVDFYVSRKYASDQLSQHSWWTRTFWPNWFAFDNVFLSSEHLPYLLTHFKLVKLSEQRATVPYIPLCKVPYFYFIGKKV